MTEKYLWLENDKNRRKQNKKNKKNKENWHITTKTKMADLLFSCTSFEEERVTKGLHFLFSQ